MGKYGDAAVRATLLLQLGACSSPPDAWRSAVHELFPTSPASQAKSCPKSTYLGLCERGLVAGVKPGNYTRGTSNKEYALEAVRLLTKEPALAAQGPDQLWRRVMAGRAKKYNQQMDVVLALWTRQLIVQNSGQ